MFRLKNKASQNSAARYLAAATVQKINMLYLPKQVNVHIQYDVYHNV